MLDKHYYILDSTNTVVPVNTVEEWAEWREKNREPIVQEEVTYLFFFKFLVSTVFLGINHDFYSSKNPLVFETMIFFPIVGYRDFYCERHATYWEAREGHDRALDSINFNMALEALGVLWRLWIKDQKELWTKRLKTLAKWTER